MAVKQEFNKQSRFNAQRDSYVDEAGNYVYCYSEKTGDKYVKKRTIIPLTEETKDIIVFLDKDDHQFDLISRYNEENEDYGFRNLTIKYERNDDEFSTSPIEAIPDKQIKFFDETDDENVSPLKQEIIDFIVGLPESQQDLIYKHLGMNCFLEDIRREEEALTGKSTTKQAMHNRWTKIINKACKHFRVEKPKKSKKK